MRTEITIRNLQKRTLPTISHLTTIARKTLKVERVAAASLSIVFVTDTRIRTLNKKYLHRNHPTDVLAFDLAEKPSKKHIIGEVIISTDTAYKNARLYKTSLKREVCLYVIHGILHLIGYDDHTARARVRMQRREQELLQKALR